MMEGFDSPLKEEGINPYFRILSTKLTNSSNLEVYFVSVNQSENMQEINSQNKEVTNFNDSQNFPKKN